MYADVELEMFARAERLAAHVAEMRALPGVRPLVAAQRVEVPELSAAQRAAQRQRRARGQRVCARAVRQQVPACVHTAMLRCRTLSAALLQ